MTTQTYRRARHSVSLLHAHLVFVTKYRHRVFTLIGKPSARCNRRISAQSSTDNIPSVLPSSGRARSPDQGVNFQLPRRGQFSRAVDMPNSMSSWWSSTAKPTTCICLSPIRPPWRFPFWCNDSKGARLTPCAVNTPGVPSAFRTADQIGCGLERMRVIGREIHEV